MRYPGTKPAIKPSALVPAALAALLLLATFACVEIPETPEPSPTPTPEMAGHPVVRPVAADSPTPTAVPSPTATPTLPPPTPTLPLATKQSPAQEEPIPAPEVQLPNVADTVERARPAVVSVVGTAIVQGIFGPQSRPVSGTGVIFTSDGLVLTNNHVLEGALEITLTLDDGSQLEAELIGADRLSDLAVLRLPPGDYDYLPVKNDLKPRVGQWVIAIGNALALPGGPTVTVGVISALGRSRDTIGGTTLNDLIQTDTVMNPGNSGGPLIDLNGDLVGINTAVVRSGYGRSGAIEGIAFAINMETVAEISSQLIELGRVRWAYMGISLDDLSAEAAARAGLPFREGAVVVTVGDGTPAHLAGLLPGDVILSLDGEPVGTVRDLLKLLRQELEPGQAIDLELFREGDVKTVEMVLGERPTE